jgi:hypothetical protein
MDTTNRDPEDDVVAKALLQALVEIHIYRSRHAMDELKQVSIKALAAAGVFSSQTVTFLENHQARFYGFPQRIAPDIVVLDIVTAAKRFVGFSDGHVERQAPENKPAVCAQDAI